MFVCVGRILAWTWGQQQSLIVLSYNFLNGSRFHYMCCAYMEMCDWPQPAICRSVINNYYKMIMLVITKIPIILNGHHNVVADWYQEWESRPLARSWTYVDELVVFRQSYFISFNCVQQNYPGNPLPLHTSKEQWQLLIVLLQ